MSAPCPVCQRTLPDPPEHRPFCSARCHLIDLGKWLDGDYSLPSFADDSGPGRREDDGNT